MVQRYLSVFISPIKLCLSYKKENKVLKVVLRNHLILPACLGKMKSSQINVCLILKALQGRSPLSATYF